MSLYRQYRPTTFTDVTGQEHVVTTLEQAVRQEKLSHAYLFAGTRGTGKTSIARILAKAMLTQGLTDTTLRRQIEDAVDNGSLVDCTEIDAASNRGIDDIRNLLEKMQFTPVVARAKVTIIDEVHMLTKEAFNALLKTLEEPPAYAYFILATTELHKIPATIQSRCQRFLFHNIAEEDIVRRLQYIADQEHIVVERPALRAIAHHVQGGLRDAISLLDQLRSLPQITLRDVQERIGESGNEHVEQLLQALDQCDAPTILKVTRDMEECAAPFETILRMLLSSARDRLHRAVEEEGNGGTQELRMIDALLTPLRDIRSAPVPALVFESALLSLLHVPGSDAIVPPSSVPRMPSLRPSPPPSSPALHSPTTASNTPTRVDLSHAATVLAPAVSLDTVLAAWPEIVDTIEPPFVRMSLKNGQPIHVDGNTIVVRFTSSFHREKASSTEGWHSMQETLERVFKRPLSWKYIVETDDPPAPATSEVNVAEAALEVF